MSTIPTTSTSLQSLSAQEPRVARAKQPRLALAAEAKPKTDSVELSAEALSQSLKFEPPIREDLVARIKAQIEAGTYDDEGKLPIVADRLARDFLA